MIELRVCALLVIAGALAPGIALAQDVTFKDAIHCSDFKKNSDGSWFTESASMNYGPGNRLQTNFFDAKIKKGSAKAGEPDMWTLLNEKCGAAH